MNIFTIPSWYPSDFDPLWGKFCETQVKALAEVFSDDNFAISLWGQTSKQNLLFAREPVKSIYKYLSFKSTTTQEQKLSDNVLTFTTPVLTWTRKILDGNIKSIVLANEKNFLKFKAKVGHPHLIHAHVGYPAGFIAMKLSQKYHLPFIVTEHLDPFPTEFYLDSKGKIASILSHPMKNCHSLIVENLTLQKCMEEWGFSNTICIPNMVDETNFGRAEVNKNSTDFTFFFLGGMIDRKGVMILLKAISLIDRDTKISVRLGGSGSSINEYKAYAKEIDVGDRVKWLGFLNEAEVLREYQQCDAFVLPSKSENLGMVLIEAIACGKPVISTACGVPEVIVNASNGVLVEVNNAEALALAMLTMKENYSKYDPAVIRRDFENRFSRRVVAEQIMEVYRKVTYDYRASL